MTDALVVSATSTPSTSPAAPSRSIADAARERARAAVAAARASVRRGRVRRLPARRRDDDAGGQGGLDLPRPRSARLRALRLRRQRPGRRASRSPARSQMRRVLVPPAPGVFSAVGLLLSEIEHEFVRTLTSRGESASSEVLHAGYRELEAEAERALVAEGVVQRDDRPLPLRRHPLRGTGLRADDARRGRRSRPRPDRGRLQRRAPPHLWARLGGCADRHRQPEADRARERERRRPVRPAGGTWWLRAQASRAVPTSVPTRVARRRGGLARRAARLAAAGRAADRRGVRRHCVVPPGCRVTLDALGNIDIASRP